MNNEDNVIRFLEGKPHEAMSIEQVMDAIEKDEPFIAEPGYMKQIIEWARLGKEAEIYCTCG